MDAVATWMSKADRLAAEEMPAHVHMTTEAVAFWTEDSVAG